MSNSFSHFLCVYIMLSLFAQSGRSDEGTDFFEKKIRPVLVKKCYRCHSGEAAINRKLKGNLQLDTREGIRKGGQNGPAIVPGNVEESLLIDSIRRESLEMPPDEKLSEEVIAHFTRWVKMGAPDPRDGKPVPVPDEIDYGAGRKHWAYQPLNVETPSKVSSKSWSNLAIDHYLLSRMEQKNVQPTYDAEPVTVLRRLSFDLIGLPPTLEQVERFESLEPSEVTTAYEKLVDELLASPQFGEHWARHWFDGIRYAANFETSAFYRNWVINAFNNDMPYHQFLQRQIAGDLIRAKDDDERRANLTATQLLMFNLREADFVEASLEVIGQQMMGISFNCAKCHDHKYDAFSQKDYYALAGILKSSQVPKAARDGITLPGTKTKIITLAEAEKKKIGDAYLQIGGDPSRRGAQIPRRLPLVFFEEEPAVIQNIEESGRRELAEWIGTPDHPLTARVMVNRIWLWMMGRGIVTTPNDFGANGERPSHPELLDYLAFQLVQSKGSLKAVIREIALSRAYRLSVERVEHHEGRDHQNELFSRAIPKRLRAEQVMDSLLLIADRLEPGVQRPVATINKWPNRKRKDRSYGGARSIYVRVDEFAQKTFDAPNPELLIEERARSVTAPQLLFLMNSQMVRDLSEATAKRIESVTDSEEMTTKEKIQQTWRLILGRSPKEGELLLAVQFLETQKFSRLVHSLICSNEFIHLN